MAKIVLKSDAILRGLSCDEGLLNFPILALYEIRKLKAIIYSNKEDFLFAEIAENGLAFCTQFQVWFQENEYQLHEQKITYD